MTQFYSPTAIQGGIDEYKGEWKTAQISHLLKRTMFGSSPDDIAYFQKKTVSQTIDELLATPSPVEPPLNYYDTADYKDPQGIKFGETWVNAIYGDGTVNSRRRASYKYWWAIQMATQKRNINEKMVLFWHNHFATEINDVDDARFVYVHNTVLRKYSMGNFKDFVRQITLDPAMLRYLNGRLNTKNAPDENYGRELQELFSIGKGPGSLYTEQDVKEAAKALTGWRINATTYQSYFDSTKHSAVSKQFSSFYNNTLIAGRTGATAGDMELDDLLTMIFAQGEVAKFMVRKLYRWFVYYEIDAVTENNVIAPLADIFRNNNYAILPVLSALFKSEHFFDSLNQGCVIKTPADLVIGSMREFSVSMPMASDWDTSYGHWNTLYSLMNNQGLKLHDPPNVAGMPAYYQEPLFHEIWISSDSLPKRNQFTDIMTNSGYTRNAFKMQFDFIAFAKTLPNPGNPNDLIDDTIKRIYRISVSPQLKQQMKTQLLLSNQQYDYYWTNAWADYIANPIVANYNIVNTRLKDLFRYLMNLSEYQLS